MKSPKDDEAAQQWFYQDCGNMISWITPSKNQLWITNCLGQFQDSWLRLSSLLDYSSETIKYPCIVVSQQEWATAWFPRNSLENRIPLFPRKGVDGFWYFTWLWMFVIGLGIWLLVCNGQESTIQRKLYSKSLFEKKWKSRNDRKRVR